MKPDESSAVSNVIADRKLCYAPSTYEPSGGVNVSRVIKIMGGETLAMYPVGGPTGQMFQYLLDKAGLNSHSIPIESH